MMLAKKDNEFLYYINECYSDNLKVAIIYNII